MNNNLKVNYPLLVFSKNIHNNWVYENKEYQNS